MSWKFSSPAAGAAAPATGAPAVQPAATHPLPPPTAAAALPAVGAPAPAGVAPAPAPEPTRRRRRSASEIAADAAKAAPVPATQPAAAPMVAYQPTTPATQPAAAPRAYQPTPLLTPTVYQPTPAATPATLPAGGWLALFTPVDPSRTAGAAVAAIAAQKGGEPNIFPTIALTGGDAGGLFDYDDMNEEGSDDSLPTGRKPFSAVLLTYRLLVLGWPRAASGAGGPKVTPRFQGIISAVEGEAADIATAAQKKYQFRTGRPEQRGAPEPFYDALCHPAIAIEALCFEPEAGLIAVRSTYTYESMVFTNSQINNAFPKNEKGIPVISAQPVIIQPETWKTKGSKKQPDGWLEHGIKISAATAPLSAEIQQTVEAFRQFYAQAGMNPDLGQAISDWCKHTLSVNDLDILRQIAYNAH